MVFSLQKTKILAFSLFLVGLIVNVHTVNGYLLTSSFTDINGNSTSLSVYEGKLLFVEAFASDCSWCQKEHSELEKLHTQFVNEIYMVAISIKSDAQTDITLAEYLALYPTSWPIGFDDGFQFTQQFNVRSTPTMFLFNQEGRLLIKQIGFTPYAELSSIIGQYLAISNPDTDDTITGYEDGDSSGSVIEDLFGSTLFRISFITVFVVLIYVKMTAVKAVV